MAEQPELFKARKKKREKPPDPYPGETKRLILAYRRLFMDRFGSWPVVQPRDAAALKRIVTQYGPKDAELYLTAYMGLRDDYLERVGFVLSLMPSRWNAITVLFANQESLVVGCLHVPKCQTPAIHTQRMLSDRKGTATASSCPATSKSNGSC